MNKFKNYLSFETLKKFFYSEEWRNTLRPLLLYMQNAVLILYLVVSFGRAYERNDDKFPGIFLTLCILLVITVPFVYKYWCKLYIAKEKQLWYQEKVDNINLTAWKETEYPNLFPWHMVYIVVVAVLYYIADHHSIYISSFLLLSLLQYGFKLFTPNRKGKYDFPEQVWDNYYNRFSESEDGYFLWPDYSNYCLLLNDDTNQIPVTFNKGIYRPTADSYIFYDFKRDIDINPKFHAKNCMYWIYLHAKLFVYVLDASKYENLTHEIERALTFVRHRIAKPVYIFILTKEPETLGAMIEHYSWMPFVTIELVTDIRQIDLCKVREAQLTGTMIGDLQGFTPFSLRELGDIDKSSYFRSCNLYSSYIYKGMPQVEELYYYHASNYYLCGFFHNMFRNTERKLAILAGFDYVDMVLRFVLYHLAVKKKLGFQERLVDDDIQFMGDEIVKLLDETDCLYETVVRKTVPVNDTVENALIILEEYFPLKFEGKEINFQGLVYLIRVLRNQTRGHGAIQDAIVEPLWYALYVLFVLFSSMLQVYNFEIQIGEDYILTGYTKDG
ncbi:MAG: hypothetical protein IJ379_08865, partial [Lachnospiraceae bacterium]|nr:hypothetical protein [Lachnospiraceae bacterium]